VVAEVEVVFLALAVMLEQVGQVLSYFATPAQFSILLVAQ